MSLLIYHDQDQATAPIRVDASANIFDPEWAVIQFGQSHNVEHPLEPREVEAWLPRLLDWHDDGNLYPADRDLMRMAVGGKLVKMTRGNDLASWMQLWKSTDSDALQGHVRYQGGDLHAKADADPEQLTPDDFRLRPDSAGYRAGPDGKDLGADVDLVGPGKAYERWKKTPEYEEWLKETQELMAREK